MVENVLLPSTNYAALTFIVLSDVLFVNWNILESMKFEVLSLRWKNVNLVKSLNISKHCSTLVNYVRITIKISYQFLKIFF